MITIPIWKLILFLFVVCGGTVLGCALAMRSIFKTQARLHATREEHAKGQAYRRVPAPPKPDDDLNPYK